MLTYQSIIIYLTYIIVVKKGCLAHEEGRSHNLTGDCFSLVSKNEIQMMENKFIQKNGFNATSSVTCHGCLRPE